MSLVYVTGVPGTGKSTVHEALLERGQASYDIDTANLTIEQPRIDVPTGVWALDTEKILKLKQQHEFGIAYICGVVYDDTVAWDLFDLHFALIASKATVKQRLQGRHNHPHNYGSTDAECTQVIQRMPLKNTTYSHLDAILLDASQQPWALANTIMTRSQRLLKDK
jgi:broad-specificity NMP kinase